MTAAAPTAAWSLDRLVMSLSKGGWGDDLDGAPNAGLQRVLNALSALLPWEAAEGRLTRAQVADAASMSAKWAGHCLRRLEALGLVTWHRGWIDRGRPRAGWIRVHKSRLAELVRAARGHLDPRRQERRAQTQHRLSTTLRRTSVPPWRHRPLSERRELSAPLHTKKYRAQAPGLSPTSPTLPIGADMPACAVCGRSEHACQVATQKEPRLIRHQYEPSRLGQVSTILAPAHELHPPATQKQHRGGWRALVAQLTPPTHPTLMDGDQQ